MENTVTTQKAQLVDTQASLATAVRDLDRSKIQGKAWQAELARCKSEGDGMRDEVHLVTMRKRLVLTRAAESLFLGAAAQSFACTRGGTVADRRIGAEAAASRDSEKWAKVSL